jgi:hypothetical protein
MNNLLFILLILLLSCSPLPESSSLNLSSLATYESNDCSGSGIEVACTDEDGNVLGSLILQISCVAEGFTWINYYQEWLNSIDNIDSFSSSMNPNDNTCIITYDAVELIGVWAEDSKSCQIPNSTITSGNCVEFIFTH